MVQEKRNLLRGMLSSAIGICIVLPACRNPSVVVSPKVHLAIVSEAGATLYLDRLESRSVMKEDVSSGSKTIFCSFLVGWQDSAFIMDKKKGMAREKYFQYDMQKDWVALVKGDSVYPVFFQERPGLNSQLKEGALVFEIPAGARADTLVYKDSFGVWGTRLFVLNGSPGFNANLNRK